MIHAKAQQSIRDTWLRIRIMRGNTRRNTRALDYRLPIRDRFLNLALKSLGCKMIEESWLRLFFLSLPKLNMKLLKTEDKPRTEQR